MAVYTVWFKSMRSRGFEATLRASVEFKTREEAEELEREGFLGLPDGTEFSWIPGNPPSDAVKEGRIREAVFRVTQDGPA